MKIAVDISPLSSGHKVRGVGAYVSLLKNNIEKFDNKNKYTFFEGKAPESVDLVHYPYFDPFFPVLPFKKKIRTAVTVHDLTPIKFKKHFPSGIRGGLNWQYNKKLLKKVDTVIVDSECSKKDVVEFAGVDSKKIKVVYLASDPIYKKLNIDSFKNEIKKKFGLPDNFFLYVGDVTWNKNLPRIVEAALSAKVNLVLVGKAIAEGNFDKNNPWNSDRKKVRELIDNNKNIKVLGFVDDGDLVKIYNISSALLMPSLYEGFGLPVLEAMSCGCPVITSKEGSLPEVGGDAVIYADAYSKDSIVKEMLNISNDENLRSELSKKGLEQAKKFSIEKMMKDTINALL